jgi:hypothetical protein
MDKKVIGVLVVALILLIFQDEIKEFVGTLNTVQTLMLGQIIILGSVLVILAYYLLSRFEE